MSNLIQMTAAVAAPSAAGGAAKPADPMAGLMSFMPIVIIFVLFYILFIMPQRKQQKKHQELLKTLKNGDEVMTSGGMFGRISSINEKENTVFLKMAEGAKIEIQRSSISGFRNNPAADPKK